MGDKILNAVLFYAKWCPHCEKPSKFWNSLELDGIHFMKIEEQEFPNNIKEHITSFPTIKFFHDTKESINIESCIEDYQGERTKDAIIEYSKKMLQNLDSKSLMKGGNQKSLKWKYVFLKYG